jgi:hypothetical protein
MDAELGSWSPLPPDELIGVMGTVEAPWWLAGGWALDAFLGRVTRRHEDTDVLILRADHVRVRHALAEWDAHAADPPGSLRPWAVGEGLPARVQDVWLRRRPGDAWSFQFMIDETAGNQWIYRRDARVQRSLESLSGPASRKRCRVLAPEIQLLYKSRAVREKDQADFSAVVPALDERQRAWLRDALRLTAPGHTWLDAL